MPTKEGQAAFCANVMHSYQLPGLSGPGHFLRSPPVPSLVSGWLAPGREVKVQGVSLPHGMVYLGWPRGGAPSPNDYSYLDPRLPVADRSEPDEPAPLVEYARMTPTHRRTYLDWLASGRRSRDVQPMLVLRFLHGLQRRVVEDTTHGPQTADERALLLAELEGLLDAYAECFPFLRARLLALLHLLLVQAF